ncbi:MAG: hypothetical protein ACYC7I_09400 [Gammaproteobacteria bacterium]
MQAKFTLLVNTSDGFADCWTPFFTLLSRNWPDYRGPIILNTELKQWSYPGMDIRCSQVQFNDRRRRTWSECLLAALDQVTTPLVLYFHEDYFMERPVAANLIDEFATLMLGNDTLRHIGLTHFGSRGPFAPTDDARLWRIDQKARYRISTQVGLWRVDTLKSYLRPEENAWMFEIFGTRRARHRPDIFLTVNPNIYCPSATPIVQYTHTGIIKGKWHPAMPALFAANGVQVDFARRGFYKSKPRVLEKLVTLRKLITHPLLLSKALLGR